MLADRPVGGEDRLVEVLEGVMATGATASPLHDDREVGIAGGDVDDLEDTVDGQA